MTDITEQAADLLEATFYVMAQVDFELQCGALDADARADAVQFLSDATQFCDLLLQAWAHDTGFYPEM